MYVFFTVKRVFLYHFSFDPLFIYLLKDFKKINEESNVRTPKPLHVTCNVSINSAMFGGVIC